MSFFSSILGSFRGDSKAQDLTQIAQIEKLAEKDQNIVAEFGESLTSTNPLKVPFARAMSHLQRSQMDKAEQKRDPSNLPITKHRAQFALNMKQLEKAVTRITLLECVVGGMTQFNLPLEQAYKKEDEKLLKKICPGLFVVESKEEQLTLLRDALEYHNSRLNGLFHQIVRWTLLQPNRSNLKQEQVFEMITEVLARIKCKFKSNDPTVPFLKIAIQERAKWYLQNFESEASFEKLFELLVNGNELIFKQIPEMYYNSFLGADHPKVQENLRNQNDLVKIQDADIKERILQLQLQAIAEVLAPSDDEIVICSQVLQNCFIGHELGIRENRLFQAMMQKWEAIIAPRLKVIPLQYFITHEPSHLDPNSSLEQDLQEYKSLEQRASLLIQEAPIHESQWLERTVEIIREKEFEIARIEKLSQKYMEDYVEHGLQLAKYPPNLDESVTDLQIRVWTLESELAKANPLTKKFIEITLNQAQKKFNKKLGIAVQKTIAQSAFDRSKNELQRLENEGKRARSELKRANNELVEARIKFRGIMSNQLQTIKDELNRLAQKEYKFSAGELKAIVD